MAMGHVRPHFSVIVPTYNRPAQLKSCLDGLARLDYPREGFEVIVVNDGGESVVETITRFHGKLAVKLIDQANAGPAAARNRGASEARGRFLAFLDDDCAPAANWLSTLAETVTRRPRCVIGGQTINALTDNTFSTTSQLQLTYLYSHYNVVPHDARFLTSNNLALSKDMFDAVGGFDTTFPRAAGEDRELCDRWLSHGYHMIYAPDLVTYHAHALTLRTFLRQHFNYGRGAYLFRLFAARRSQRGIRFEPPLFYVQMLGYPFRTSHQKRVIVISVLLAVSQLANVAGFFWEWGSSRKWKWSRSWPAMSVR